MNIQNDTAMTPLRQRMIEDMTARNLHPHTQRSHLSGCTRLVAFLGARRTRRRPTTFAGSSSS